MNGFDGKVTPEESLDGTPLNAHAHFLHLDPALQSPIHIEFGHILLPGLLPSLNRYHH